MGDTTTKTRALLLKESAPALTESGVDALRAGNNAYTLIVGGLHTLYTTLKQQLAGGTGVLSHLANLFTFHASSLLAFVHSPIFFDALQADARATLTNNLTAALLPYAPLLHSTGLAQTPILA